MDGNEAYDVLAQQAGETVGRCALGESVSYDELYGAVAFSLISAAETDEEVFDPHLHVIADLFVTP